jgi:hypothetical protein
MVDLHGLPAAGEYWLAMMAKVDQEATSATHPERDFSIIDEDVKLAAIKICMNRGISTTPKQVDGASRQPGIGNGSNEPRHENGGGRGNNYPRDTANGAYGSYSAKNNRGRPHHHHQTRERTRSPVDRRRRAASPPPPPQRNGGKR